MLFFSDEVGIILEPFNLVHISLFVFSAIIIFLIVRFREKIRNYKHERKFAIIVAVAALLWEFGLYTWLVANGNWVWADNLPISLCAFTLYIAIFALYYKKYRLFAVGYFWTWGALASVLFPDILFSYDRYRFYQFMLGHLNFFLMYIYMIFVYKWYPTWKDFWRSSLTLMAIVIILIITSNAIDANLMFMLNGAGSPFEMFESLGYIGYLTGVIIMSFCICFIWFTPFMIYHKKNQIK